MQPHSSSNLKKVWAFALGQTFIKPKIDILRAPRGLDSASAESNSYVNWQQPD